MTGEPEILGIHIPKYKNLLDVWLPWSDGLTLIGRNGAGKTNLLEALALLIGDDEAVDQVAGRADASEAPGLSIIVRGDPFALPRGPEALGPSSNGGTDTIQEQFDRDRTWWNQFGISQGKTFQEAALSLPLTESVQTALHADLQHVTVQYTLSASGLPSKEGRWYCATCEDRGEAEHLDPDEDLCLVCGEPTDFEPDRRQRLFTRTLLTRDPPAAPAMSVPALSLMGTPVAGSSGWHAMLDLPETTRVPATLQWLPRSRDRRIVSRSLTEAFTLALPAVRGFIDLLGTKIPAEPELDPDDAHWWLHKIGETAANDELRRTAPQLYVESIGGSDGEWELGVVPAPNVRLDLGPTHGSALDKYSAGQRRWMDEALATAGTAMLRHGWKCALYYTALEQVSDDELLNAVAPGDQIAAGEGYWSEVAIDATISRLDPVLVAIAQQNLVSGAFADSLRGAPLGVLQSLIDYIRHSEQRVNVRVFDEPEAHLHIDAQRSVASALEALRNAGDNIVVASHSPMFIDLDGWTTIHLRDGSVQPVPALTSNARSDLARDLGLTRGELLAGITSLLIVEGLHDQRVIESLFGSDLSRAGVAVLRMLGTNNLLSTVDMDFIERYVDVPVTVMLDYTRKARVLGGKAVTDEEKKLANLRRAARSKGMAFDFIGLERPDITCYLSETAVRSLHPDFPGWAAVLGAFEKMERRPPFKTWLKGKYHVDLESLPQIEQVLERMHDQDLRPVGELSRAMNELLASPLE